MPAITARSSDGVAPRAGRGFGDISLIVVFALFAFTSLVMEPYFVFGMLGRRGDPFALAWRFYAERWDPVFLDPPLFLRIICGIDLFVFGPFYLVAAYAFLRRRSWIRVPGLLYCSAMTYSTTVYFLYEFLAESGRAYLPMVVLVNVPYTLLGLALLWRLRRPSPF